jgi:hypothetical protein
MNHAQKITIVLSIALLWVALDFVNKHYFTFLQVSDFVYSIYWLSGIRLIAIILFGWLGVLGVGLGYVVGGLSIRGFDLQDALALGALSSIAPWIAYRLWQQITKVDNYFIDVSIGQLCGLVLLHSVFTAIFRNAYFFLTGKPNGLTQILTLFGANVLGTFLLLYVFRYLRYFYRYMKH